MKLLMITRKVDRTEHLAGFIYNWVKKIGENVDELRVISWQEGDSSGLPENIKVTHLKTKQSKVIKFIKFIIAVNKNIKEADGVFCHQMPIYTILAAPAAKWHKKKIVSWYMHRQLDWRVRLMEFLADKVLSASAESFPLPTKKLVITGHGIDVSVFTPAPRAAGDVFNIISVGRISPTKDYESMIKAVNILRAAGINNIKLTIIGDAGLAEQNKYFENLKEMVKNMNLAGAVEFLGPKPNREIPNLLQQADLFINMSGTGSIDKAVLEAMACGCLVITANSAFEKILPPAFRTRRDQPAELAEKIKGIISQAPEEKSRYRDLFREEVVKNHNLDNLAKIIVRQFS